MKSFDIIGNIAIFNHKITRDLANKLLKKHKNIKTVAYKSEIHKGKYRLKKIKIIAGEKTKETIHKESGCLLKLNVEKCYFSPRTSNERIRICKQIKPNESILVMFSGIGALPVIISKNSKAKEIYGIELNPVAYKYALENVKLNRLSNVRLFKGDVGKLLPKINKKFDRILMPLPKDAENFLPLALKKIKSGGIIHLYLFSQEKDFVEFKKKYSKYKPKLVKCGSYSPGKFRICLDLKL